MLQPIEVSDITIRSGSIYVAALRASNLSVDTMKSYVQALQTMMDWACQQGFRDDTPKYRDRSLKTRSKRQGRGRALTEEEFVHLVMEAKEEPAWQWLISGLYLSGLRTDEAARLTWDRTSAFCVDMTREFPVFMVQQGGDKSQIERIFPMAPDFAQMLGHVPAVDRKGPVFPVSASAEYIQKRIKGLCKKVGLVVTRHPKIKYCGAHDLRRSFGTRWAMKVSAPVLKEMMRHTSLAVTEQYYLHLRTDDVSRYLWAIWRREHLEVEREHESSYDPDVPYSPVSCTIGTTVGVTF